MLHGFACAKPESAALERNRWCSIPIPPYPIHLHWESTRDAKHQLPYIMKEWSNIGILMTITVVILKVWEFSLWLETRYHIFSCFQMIKSLTLIFLTCFVITFIHADIWLLAFSRTDFNISRVRRQGLICSPFYPQTHRIVPTACKVFNKYLHIYGSSTLLQWVKLIQWKALWI